uniref:threonine--tRNA ligase n=1 Tax=Myripristis murdjan TaxID=586833 RepID=A0A667XAG1_9TELE
MYSVPLDPDLCLSSPLQLQVSPALSERLRVFESLRKKRSNEKTVEVTGRPLSVRLADGRTVEGKAGITTPLLVAQSARVKGALLSKVNGELWELGRPLEADCELQLLGFDTLEGKQVITPFPESWVPKNCLRCIVASNKLRLQLIEEQMNGPTVTLYRHYFLCPSSLQPLHSSSFPPCFPLHMQVSPVTLANHPQSSGVMRLLAVAFPGEKDKDEWEREQEEARKRDHRRIGKDQELFFFNDVSPGSCFFLPKGAHIYNTLTDFIKSEYRRRGFTEVVTPTLYSTALWERSGHWEHYSENMFTVTGEGSQTYALKPMNCPAHCLMFEQRVRSWRELPLRWADFGALHRNELSGALGGLTRVRRFCQDDAHIFCTPEQLEEEIVACLDFVKTVYQVFGFSFHCLLSTRPTPCLGEPELWDTAEQQLERSLQQFGEHWELNPGDGAFYGPKIDIQIKDAIGRQHQCATIQLDFQLPIRFNLQYVGPDGQIHKPVMIHRAVLGSLERMIAILAENFGGKWPLWLSPAQVMVIPVGGDSESYAKQVSLELRILLVGEKECESGTVSVRSRRGKQLGRRPIEEVLSSLTQLRDTRSNQDDF